ncbi:MAG TPA: hypothetical protein VD866_12075 [Urbifossiella sp.]|nr:hypothetical protein [Urbifossiella sp.]
MSNMNGDPDPVVSERLPGYSPGWRGAGPAPSGHVHVLPPGMTVEPSPAAFDHLIGHLRAEIDRLTAARKADADRYEMQLSAEREHVRRLMAGYARAVGGLSSGLGALRLLKADADNGDASKADGIDAVIDDMTTDYTAADTLVLPTAGA